MDRPPSPNDAPDGAVYVIVPSDRWVAVGNGATERRCRRMVAGHRPCGEVSVAALNRGRVSYNASGTIRATHESWWHYCPDHLYGNWVEAGAVFHWELADEAAE